MMVMHPLGDAAANDPADALDHPFAARVGAPAGASSNIATELVVRSPADGYTLLSVNSSNLINATLYEKLPYKFLRDIDPIASFSRIHSVPIYEPHSNGSFGSDSAARTVPGRAVCAAGAPQ
jgi:hypothetical protein